MLPLPDREVIFLKDVIEYPPTRYLLLIQSGSGYNTLGVDYAEDTGRNTAFYRFGPQGGTQVVVLPPQTIWCMIRRDDFHILTRRAMLVQRKDDEVAEKSMFKEVWPEHLNRLEAAVAAGAALAQASEGVKAATLPEGHRGPYA